MISFSLLALDSLDLRQILFRCSGFQTASKTPSLRSFKQFEAALLKPLRSFSWGQIRCSLRAGREKAL